MSKEYSAGDKLPASDVNEIVRSGGLYKGAGSSANNYVITVSPVPTNYSEGDVFRFKADATNTGASTLNVNSKGAKAIKKNVSEDLVAGEILAGQMITVQFDGTNFQLIKDISGAIEASDDLLLSADTERTSTSVSYVKIKEIRVARGGRYRVKFDLFATSSSGYGRIYKNGVALGTEQTAGPAYVTKSEDLTFSAGDTIELWVKVGSGVTSVSVKNFRIYGKTFKSSTVITD